MVKHIVAVVVILFMVGCGQDPNVGFIPQEGEGREQDVLVFDAGVDTEVGGDAEDDVEEENEDVLAFDSGYDTDIEEDVGSDAGEVVTADAEVDAAPQACNNVTPCEEELFECSPTFICEYKCQAIEGEPDGVCGEGNEYEDCPCNADSDCRNPPNIFIYECE